MTNDFTKTITIGCDEFCNGIFITIKYEYGKLTIIGHSRHFSGQIYISTRPEDIHSPTRPISEIKKLWNIWDIWHLNNMKAGTKKQEKYLRAKIKELKRVKDASISRLVKEAGYNDYYDFALDLLDKVGLKSDGGYVYGSQWLKVNVPDSILKWLMKF